MKQIFGTYDGNKADICKKFCHYQKKNNVEVSLIGEIFNRAELNKILKCTNHHGNSENLADLLLNAYSEWGKNCPNEIIGRFSLSVYDPHQNLIFIARDHAGLKPLYYTKVDGKFAYSSEIKSLIGLNWIPKDIDLTALNYYFAYRFIPDEMTIYKYIRKLPAGCALLYNSTDKTINKWHYWEPPTPETVNLGEEELVERLGFILNDALKMRINGQSSPGVFLSGGLDSSLMVALMSKYLSNPVKTFSIGFDLKKYDELPYCRIISDHFQTNHHDIIIKPDFNQFMEILNTFDEPFANPSIIPNYYAARAASSEVDSVITGDGADGLFLGLRTHLLSMQHSRRYNIIPAMIWKPLNAIIDFIPDEVKWSTFIRYSTPEDFFKARNLVFGANLRKKLLAPWIQQELKDNIYDPENNIIQTMNRYHGTFIDKMGYATFKADADDSFFKTDRIGNKFSIKIRTPFLDKRVIEFAFRSVNSAMKIRGNTTKYIIKKYARDLLPAELPVERKKGFNPPFSEWLRNEWWTQTRDTIMDGNNSFLNMQYLEKLLKLHKNGILYQGRTIFSLLCFRVWEKNHLNN